MVFDFFVRKIPICDKCDIPAYIDTTMIVDGIDNRDEFYKCPKCKNDCMVSIRGGIPNKYITWDNKHIYLRRKEK